MNTEKVREGLEETSDALEKLSEVFSPALALEIFQALISFSGYYYLHPDNQAVFKSNTHKLNRLLRDWLTSFRDSSARRKDYRPLLNAYCQSVWFLRNHMPLFWCEQLLATERVVQKVAFEIGCRSAAFSELAPILFQCLENPAFKLRQEACDYLLSSVKNSRSHNDASLLEGWVSKLRHESEEIRNLARELILLFNPADNRSDPAALINVWHQLWYEPFDVALRSKGALMLLKNKNTDVIPYLLDQLNQVDLPVFVKIWGGLEKASIPIPITTGERFFRHQKASVRLKIFKALGDFDSPRIQSRLSQALKDPNPNIGLLAAWKLVRFPEYLNEIRAYVYQQLHGDEAYQKAMALKLIARLRMEEFFPETIDLLMNGDLRLALKAAYTLGRLNVPESIEALEQIIKDESKPVALRTRSQKALSKLEKRAVSL